MARKSYEIALLIGGKVMASMGKSISAASRQLQMLQNQQKKTNSAFRTAAGLAAGYFSVNAIRNFASESTKAYADQLNAETKLEAILKNNKALQKQGPEAYRQAKAELVDVANKLQEIGIIGDDIALAGFQQMATFQMSQKEISILSAGMADLLAQQKGANATQEDAVSIGNMIGKVMDGQVGALRRVGISFTATQERALKFGNRTKRAAILAQVLQDNVGGVNAALAQTDTGKIAQAANLMGEYKEQIGQKIIPLQAKFAQWFITKLPILEKASDSFFTGVDKGIDLLSKAAAFYDRNKTAINALALGVLSATAAFKTLSVISSVITAVKTFSSVITILGSGPIGWAILAIGALVAAGYLLYKNWDKISTFFIDKINLMIEFLNGLILKLNKIPGVNIGTIGKLGESGTPSSDVGTRGALAATAGIASNQRTTITYAPQIDARGGDPEAIKRASEAAFDDFETRYKKMQGKNNRLNFEPVYSGT